MFSQTAEYALRAMVFLAHHAAAPQPTQRIAADMKVPADYLAKVLQSLTRARLVASQRGLHGGFVLTKPAGGTTVLEILNAVDPIRRIETCPLGLPEHGVQLCPLHRKLDDALCSIERVFAGTTLAELVENPRQSNPICGVQPALTAIGGTQ